MHPTASRTGWSTQARRARASTSAPSRRQGLGGQQCSVGLQCIDSLRVCRRRSWTTTRLQISGRRDRGAFQCLRHELGCGTQRGGVEEVVAGCTLLCGASSICVRCGLRFRGHQEQVQLLLCLDSRHHVGAWGNAQMSMCATSPSACSCRHKFEQAPSQGKLCVPLPPWQAVAHRHRTCRWPSGARMLRQCL